MHYWASRRRRPKGLELIPIAEYAATVHISVSGIRDLIARNKLWAYKIKGRWFLAKPPDDWVPYAHPRVQQGKTVD